MPPSAYTPNTSDEHLFQGCLEGHRLAQKYLYQRYYSRFMGIPLRYLSDRDDALSVLNQAFLKIFNNAAMYKGEGPLAGWMARIVLHTTLDTVRSQMTYKKTMHFPENAVEQPIQNDVIGRMSAEELLGLIQKLPASSRAVFSLYVIDGYKHREIAEMLGIEENTSKWHLMQARQALQAMVRKTQTLPVL